MDHLCRTGCHAGSAVGTLVIVDRSVEIVYHNSFIRTFLLADLTADTAVLTYKLSRLSVVSRRTEHVNML